MKKTILSFVILLLTLNAYSQYATSLDENMNVNCLTGHHSPIDWLTFNPPTSLGSDGTWTCDPSAGRYGTTGVTCSGLYGSPLTYHTDTSILISPRLNLSAYPHIYVNFDTKTTNFNLGAKFEILASGDSLIGYDTAISDTFSVYNKTSAMMPLFSSGDESDWVTHQVDLTDYKHIVPLSLGFRYVSAAGTSGSRWYLDNIRTTTIPLPGTPPPPPPSSAVVELARPLQPLVLTGIARDGKLRISCQAPATGNYSLAIYDMTGRAIHQQQLYMTEGQNTATISDLSMSPGIYMLKLGNGSSAAAAKVQAW